MCAARVFLKLCLLPAGMQIPECRLAALLAAKSKEIDAAGCPGDQGLAEQALTAAIFHLYALAAILYFPRGERLGSNHQVVEAAGPGQAGRECGVEYGVSGFQSFQRSLVGERFQELLGADSSPGLKCSLQMMRANAHFSSQGIEIGLRDPVFRHPLQGIRDQLVLVVILHGSILEPDQYSATRFLRKNRVLFHTGGNPVEAESEMSDDLFLKIINREIPADIIYETDDVLAFRDINPQAPLHALIIPKEHISTINDIEETQAELVGKLFLAAREIASSEGVDEDGYRVVMNCNKAGGQAVYHIHLHILGGRQMAWPPG